MELRQDHAGGGPRARGRGRGARAAPVGGPARAAGGRAEPAPFLSGPLPAAPTAVVEVDQLVRFVQHPARAFLRQRLRISLGDFSEDIEDALPVELDKLEEWKIGQRLLDARLAGTDMDTAVRAEIARGELPPGDLAGPVIERGKPTVETIMRHVAGLPEHRSGSAGVNVP